MGPVFRTLRVGWHGMVIPTWSQDTPVLSSADKAQAFSLTHTQAPVLPAEVLCPLNTLPPGDVLGVLCLRFCAFTAVEPEPGTGSNPGWGTKILHAMGHGQIITVE